MTLLFLLILSLQLYRLFVLVMFRHAMVESIDMADYGLAFFSGLRFDGSVSMLILIPTFLVSISCAFFEFEEVSARVRAWMARIALLMNAIVFSVNYMFVTEYKDTFNQWVFGAVYDDFGAVVTSAWTTYPVVTILVSTGVFYGVALWLVLKLIKTPMIPDSWLSFLGRSFFGKAVTVVCMLCVLTFCARGSVVSRPVQLKDASVTRDSFLNRMVLNPWSALRYTVKHHNMVSSAAGLESILPDGDIAGAVETLFGPAGEETLDEVMRKTSTGKGAVRPRHIFYFVMESMDSWSTLERHRSMNLMPEMERLGREGMQVRSFISASSGTMVSLSAILTGLPDVGVVTNYQPAAQRPFSTSMAPQFKTLGYQTNLFYGGYLSWQGLENFARNQGFDACYGGNHMGDWLKGNEWGVDDGDLFDFILKQLDKETPSFNLILSTSYHPPYDLDVYGKGFSLKEIPAELKDVYDGKISLKTFGHLWYSDHELGRFVREAEKRFPRALFAITGDHWSRKFLNEHPTLYESRSVPFVLYGKEVLDGVRMPTQVAGSHLDIMPTLLDLAAPEGFPYYSLGSSLLDPQRRQMGIGRGMMVTPGFMISGNRVERLPYAEGAEAPDPAEVARFIRSWRALGWWRIMKGDALPGEGRKAATLAP